MRRLLFFVSIIVLAFIISFVGNVLFGTSSSILSVLITVLVIAVIPSLLKNVFFHSRKHRGDNK